MSSKLRWILTGGTLGMGVLVVILAGVPRVESLRAQPPAELKPYVEKIPGSEIAIEMIPIPAGSFTLGSPDSEKGRTPDEGPQVQVKVGAFWMAKVETTWDAYDLFYKNEQITEGDKRREEPVVTADAVTRPTPHYTDDTQGHGREGKPCLGMMHFSASMFCRWLSMKTGKTYRLPTEAEWEYAARAGTKTPYFFGDDPKTLGDYAWYAANSEETTHPVGTKKPNPWGLHDMYGNVAEWCLDHYTPTDYQRYKDALTLNPVRKPTAYKYSHVVRGGSWADDAARLRSAARRGSEKNWLKRDPQRPQSIWWMTDCDFVGFRIVRPLEELPELKGFLPPVNWSSKDMDEK